MSTSRTSFARHEDLASNAALEALAESLRVNLKTKSVRPEQPVGRQTDFPQLHVAGLLRGAFYDTIRERLLNHPLVQDVQTVWVAPGVISIKLIASTQEALSLKQLDEVARALMSETFEQFRITMTAQPAEPNIVELNVSSFAP